MAAFDATTVTNASLRSYLQAHRAELLTSYRRMRARLEAAPIGAELACGLKHARQALGLAPGADPHLDSIVETLRASLPGYDFYTPELVFGTDAPSRPHNDVSMYLRSGQDVIVQVWILLEACEPADDGAAIRESARKNALKLWVPAAPGPYYGGTDFVLTPRGRRRYRPGDTLGGDRLGIGDALVFKNGVIHFTDGDPGSQVFRVALSLRFVLSDRTDDDNFLRWMKQLWETDPELSARADGAYAKSAKRMLLDSVPDGPLDRGRLVKIDRNDYADVVGRITRARFATHPPASEPFIPLRTAASLRGIG